MNIIAFLDSFEQSEAFTASCLDCIFYSCLSFSFSFEIISTLSSIDQSFLSGISSGNFFMRPLYVHWRWKFFARASIGFLVGFVTSRDQLERLTNSK